MVRLFHFVSAVLLIVAFVRFGSSSEAGQIAKANKYQQIAPSVWVHTSYKDLGNGVPVASNGLLVRSGDELLLVDTAWTVEQTRDILEWAQQETGRTVTRAVVTHAHEDKMGGLAALHDEQIPTLASRETNRAASERELTPATRTLAFDGPEPIVQDVEAFYPGPGHTEDNIVVYIADSRILFGGCLIRPASASTLGNTADADVAHWSTAVEKVSHRYPEAQIVVPSHGKWGDRTLLSHTIDLAGEATDTPPDQP